MCSNFPAKLHAHVSIAELTQGELYELLSGIVNITQHPGKLQSIMNHKKELFVGVGVVWSIIIPRFLGGRGGRIRGSKSSMLLLSFRSV